MNPAGFAVLLAAFAASRLVALPEPLGIDQGIFATAGWALSRGLILYRDVWDQKPPGIHLVYWLGFTLFGPHVRSVLFLDTLAGAAGCACVLAIGARLDSRRCGWWAALCFLFGTYPALQRVYGGFLERAVPETFIMALAAIAAWAVLNRAYAFSGFLIGCAAVLKPTAFIYWPAFLVFVAVHRRSDVRRAALASALTIGLPWVLVGAWLWHAGVARDAWTAIVTYNRGYLGIGAGPFALANRLAHEVFRLFKTDPLWFLAGLASILAVLAVLNIGPRDARNHDLQALGIAWLAAALVAAAANGIRMYMTYFLPAGPPLALLAGWLLSHDRSAAPASAPRRGRYLAWTAVLIAAAVGVAVHSSAVERMTRFTAADLRQLRGGADRAQYLELFGGYANGRGYSARANAELTDFLSSHTSPDERIYIFGMTPSAYFTAKRLPANRFVWTYPAVAGILRAPGFSIGALAADLARAAPADIVLERNNRDSLTGWRIEDVYAAPEIQALLRSYAVEARIEDFTVLRHR